VKRFLAVQHSFSEFLGALEPQWEARDIGFTYVRTIAGQDVAGTPSQFDALWLLGAAHPVADRGRCPWVDDEVRLVRAFERAHRPVIGLGDGALVLAAAHGATLLAEPEHDARFVRARALVGDDPVAHAVDRRRVLVMAHGRADLSSGSNSAMQPIVADEEGRWIAFRAGQLSYGLLFRPELKPGMLEDMVMEEGRGVPEDFGALIETARAEWGGLHETSARVAAALVSTLDLMEERRKMPVFRLQERT
jgi:putative intracellular protease/amidase